MEKQKILVFENGTANSGGFIMESLREAFHGDGSLFYFGEIVGVVSSHSDGRVKKLSEKYGIKFFHFPKPWSSDGYQKIASKSEADFFILADWLKPVQGLDSQTAFNSKTVIALHPGSFPEFGMKNNFYNSDIQAATLEAFKKDRIKDSSIVVHFFYELFNPMSIISKIKISISKDDDVDSLNEKVQEKICQYLPALVNLVVNKKISLVEINPIKIQFPEGYSIEI
jgi:folate-dependent phosphoribosylglycinamide formyltransferase PurN